MHFELHIYIVVSESTASVYMTHFQELQGILEEVQLIEWPSPLQAVTDTTLVIAIVAFTATVLFGVNAILADLSNIIYK